MRSPVWFYVHQQENRPKSQNLGVLAPKVIRTVAVHDFINCQLSQSRSFNNPYSRIEYFAISVCLALIAYSLIFMKFHVTNKFSLNINKEMNSLLIFQSVYVNLFILATERGCGVICVWFCYEKQTSHLIDYHTRCKRTLWQVHYYRDVACTGFFLF